MNKLLKRYYSCKSYLKFVDTYSHKLKRFVNKSFWHLHTNINYENTTYRQLKQINTIKIGKSSDSKFICLKSKLYELDRLVLLFGPNYAKTIDYFDSLLQQIQHELKALDIYALIQILFLSGIISSNNKLEVKSMISTIIKQIELIMKNDSTSLPQSTDIAVLCNCLFVLRIRFNNKSLLNRCLLLVYEDIKQSKIDISHILSIIKLMRLNDYSDNNINEALNAYIHNHFTTLLFLESTHFLAYFANISYYNTAVIDCLVNKRSSQLLNVNSSNLLNGEKLRSKDLARFLWAVSHFNHKLSPILIDSIYKHIERLIDTDFQKYPHYLLDCFKSLIIMDHYSPKIPVLLNSNDLLNKFKMSKREKIPLDLYFILESLSIERPWIEIRERSIMHSNAKMPNKNLYKECMLRPKLEEYRHFLQLNNTYLNIKLCYPLPHIGIASLVVNEVSLEIIDNYVCVNNVLNKSQHLNGLMQTKLRHLNIKAIPYKLIKSYDDFKEFSVV